MMTEPNDDDVPERTISPARDRRVRHQSGALLEPRTRVCWSAYWQRRADDGDIVVHQPRASSADAGGDAIKKD